MYEAHPNLALLDLIEPSDAATITKLASKPAKTGRGHFDLRIEDYYFSNPVARASSIMASLRVMHADGAEKATGTDG